MLSGMPATFDPAGWEIYKIAGPAELRTIIAGAPRTPGVYVFLDATGTAIYIGKAVRLRDRLLSYTRLGSFPLADVRPVTVGLFGWPSRQAESEDPASSRPDAAGAVSVGWRECLSEADALILEAKLIRTLQPRLNVLGRDDKGYTFVGFSADACPRLFLIRAPSGRAPEPDPPRVGATYIGPFTDSRALARTLDALRRTFPYPVHRDQRARCLEYEIGLCPLPPGQPEANVAPLCRRNIRAIKAILAGQSATLARAWRRQMREASARGEYERAARWRDDLAALARVGR
jgi:excinuclease ABC subunit C